MPSDARTPDFCFVFDSEGGTGVEADTLAAALLARPDLTAGQLGEVWCLRSANLVWASEGYYHNGPWQDPKPTSG